MKKISLLYFVLPVLFFTANVYSQGLQNEIKVSPGLQTDIKVVRPDFSGRWKLNPERSRWPGGSEPEGLAGTSLIMIIEQKLPAVSITVKFQKGSANSENFLGGRYTLYADGRGDELIPNARIGSSTTGWKDNKLVTAFFASGAERKLAIMAEEIELSADNNTLIHTRKYGDSICGVNIGITDVNAAPQEYLVFDRIK